MTKTQSARTIIMVILGFVGLAAIAFVIHEASAPPGRTWAGKLFTRSEIRPLGELQTIDQLWRELVEASTAHDVPKVRECTARLISFGTSAAIHVRIALARGEVTLRDPKEDLALAVSDIFKSFKSPDLSLELFKSYSELDALILSKIEFEAHGTSCLLISATVIGQSPHPRISKMILELYPSTQTMVVKKALIYLMGSLNSPELRKLLVEVASTSDHSDLASEAALALGMSPSPEIVPPLLDVASRILSSTDGKNVVQLYRITSSLTKAMPLDDVLSLIAGHIETAPRVDNIRAVGRSIGDTLVAKNETDVEPLLSKLITGASPKMQMVCLEALYELSTIAGDPRTVSVAADIYAKTEDTTVKSLALLAAMDNSADQSLVLQLYRSAATADGILGENSRIGLLQFCTRHPEFAEAQKVASDLLASSDRWKRLSALNLVTIIRGPISVEQQLRIASENEPDAELKQASAAAYQAVTSRDQH